MGIFDFFKSFINNESSVRFPNSITKEDYYKRKQEIKETALTDTVFWDKAQDIDKKEITKREKFLKLWYEANKQITEVIPTTFDKDKSKNMNIVFTSLRLANASYYQSENLSKLRNCRMIEGQMQQLYGTIQQATNCFMQILFLDLIDDYVSIYNLLYLELEDEYTDFFSDKETIIPKKALKSLIKKAYKEWLKEKHVVAPAIYDLAFQEELAIDKFEKIFKFNAENLIKSLKFEVPITADKAWEIITKYNNPTE